MRAAPRLPRFRRKRHACAPATHDIPEIDSVDTAYHRQVLDRSVGTVLQYYGISRVFADNLGCVMFLVVCFLQITNLNPRKKNKKNKNKKLREKMAQMPLFDLIFLGLGWPWVGEFDGFTVTFICMLFPTRDNLVHRKTPDHWY